MCASAEIGQSGAIGAIATMGLHLVETPVDEHGLDPAALDAILDRFPSAHPGARKPRVLCASLLTLEALRLADTIPCGSNRPSRLTCTR